MRAELNPLPDQKTAAIVVVNQYFAGVTANAAMQETAWTRKRDIARRARNDRTDDFESEARLRGLTSEAFADLILSKPDPAQLADARELRRQTALLAIDAAATSADLDAIIAGLGA